MGLSLRRPNPVLHIYEASMKHPRASETDDEFDIPNFGPTTGERMEMEFGKGRSKVPSWGRISISMARIMDVPFPGALGMFLDVDDCDIAAQTRDYAAFHTRNVAKHLDELLGKEYTALAVAGYPASSGIPLGAPGYLDAECGPAVVENHLFVGTRFLTNRDGVRLVVIQGPRESRLAEDGRQLTVPYSDYSVRVLYARGVETAALDLLNSLETRMHAKHIFRGQKIRPYGEFLRLKKRGWDDIYLDPSVMDEIQKNVLFTISNAERLKEVGIPLARGLLLEGPPGTGKSLLCTVVANETAYTFILVSPQEVTRLSDIKFLFDVAKELAPTIILFEDIDFLGEDRSQSMTKHLLGELLVQMDSLESREGVVVLATSNRPGILDAALINRPGRFDRRLVIDLPVREQRVRILEIALKSLKVTREGLDLVQIAASTEGFSGAKLRNLVETAALEAMTEDGKETPSVTMGHFESALNRVKGNGPRTQQTYVR
ncbi:MAG: ATP-binding protein [Candidatus Thermoplasmatota archaeon]|nr:ATP-binding protein [Candidatus Thermoplasmatota archaeon]